MVLNNQFNTKMNKVTFIDNYVRAGVNEGTVIVRVGWEFEEEEYEKGYKEGYEDGRAVAEHILKYGRHEDGVE